MGRSRTSPKSSNRETSFNLVYDSKVVVPIEISVETKRIKEFKVRQNEKRHREDLDILEERREIASIREAYYKQKLEGYYNKCVWPSIFKPDEGFEFDEADFIRRDFGFFESNSSREAYELVVSSAMKG
ncbi:hypothetical protein Tco_1508179 [Tanacetum coccineum]